MQAKIAPVQLAEEQVLVLPPIAQDATPAALKHLLDFYLEHRQAVLGLISVSVLLGLWEFVVSAGYFDQFFASKPSAIAAAGYQLITRGTIGAEAGTTITGF